MKKLNSILFFKPVLAGSRLFAHVLRGTAVFVRSYVRKLRDVHSYYYSFPLTLIEPLPLVFDCLARSRVSVSSLTDAHRAPPAVMRRLEVNI